MRYLVTLLEQTPTEDKTDLHSYHIEFDNMFEIANFLENFEINFGRLVSLTVVPFK